MEAEHDLKRELTLQVEQRDGRIKVQSLKLSERNEEISCLEKTGAVMHRPRENFILPGNLLMKLILPA